MLQLNSRRRTRATIVLCCGLFVGCSGQTQRETPSTASSAAVDIPIRVATYNIEDVRSVEVVDGSSARLRTAAATIQRLRPDILLINEITAIPEEPTLGLPGESNNNAQRFADQYLAVSQGEGLEPMRYQTFMGATNTGIASGFDLDNNDKTITQAPPLTSLKEPTKEQLAYGGDCWGFGVFPGQFGMALLVREELEILTDEIRTFQRLKWSSLPNAMRPVDPKTMESWYLDEEWSNLRLSSKSHWDVPIRIAPGRVLHALCSHPTPPVFDGPEDHNGHRNHDEIRFWADYLNGVDYIVDDNGRPGGLAADSHFVILGDLNADPDRPPNSLLPMRKFILNHPRINGHFEPRANDQGRARFPNLEPDDTAEWGMRADYVLPSANCQVIAGEVDRLGKDAVRVSDHFPVWVDLEFNHNPKR